MKNRFFRLLAGLFVFGFLMTISQNQIHADEVSDFYQRLARDGDIDAQYILGVMYRKGQGVPQDYEKAVYWYTKAAEQGLAEAQNNLGVMYDIGKGVPQDFKQAVYWYTGAAEQEHAPAQLNLGTKYYKGQGVPQNFKQAVYWFTKAADQEYAPAQLNLGLSYEKGKGLPQDYKRAVYWYTKAAEHGYARAQNFLGVMYSQGEKVPKNNKQAVYWFKKAAEQGDALGQDYLGHMYRAGKGVPQDYKRAVYWYTKAAEQGELTAQYNLALSYENGEGVPQDYEKAVYWYTKGAEQGVPFSQYKLALMYISGAGVPQNYKLGYVWSSLAASAGHEKAREKRDILAENLSPRSLVEAQELASKIQYKINHPTESSKSYHATPETSAVYGQEAQGFGTGFIISKEGHVLTSYHVIQDTVRIKIIIDDNLYSAKLIRKDSINDLALLKITGSFPALAFSSKRIAKMGQEVFTIGYPNPALQGVNAKLTKGSINSLTGIQDDLRLYQISIPVQPGNSGGPLLDMNGNVIGIIVAMLDAETVFEMSGSLPQNVNYAVKSNYAQALLDTLPEVSGNLLPAYPKKPFNAVVDRVKKSIVMVVAYE